MIQDIKAPITVHLFYDHKSNKAYPYKIKWDGIDYKTKSVGYHYSYRNGKNLYHVFTLSSETLSFKIVLNTENLFWTLEQISDGQPD